MKRELLSTCLVWLAALSLVLAAPQAYADMSGVPTAKAPDSFEKALDQFEKYAKQWHSNSCSNLVLTLRKTYQNEILKQKADDKDLEAFFAKPQPEPAPVLIRTAEDRLDLGIRLNTTDAPIPISEFYEKIVKYESELKNSSRDFLEVLNPGASHPAVTGEVPPGTSASVPCAVSAGTQAQEVATAQTPPLTTQVDAARAVVKPELMLARINEGTDWLKRLGVAVCKDSKGKAHNLVEEVATIKGVGHGDLATQKEALGLLIDCKIEAPFLNMDRLSALFWNKLTKAVLSKMDTAASLSLANSKPEAMDAAIGELLKQLSPGISKGLRDNKGPLSKEGGIDQWSFRRGMQALQDSAKEEAQDSKATANSVAVGRAKALIDLAPLIYAFYYSTKANGPEVASLPGVLALKKMCSTATILQAPLHGTDDLVDLSSHNLSAPPSRVATPTVSPTKTPLSPDLDFPGVGKPLPGPEGPRMVPFEAGKKLPDPSEGKAWQLIEIPGPWVPFVGQMPNTKVGWVEVDSPNSPPPVSPPVVSNMSDVIRAQPGRVADPVAPAAPAPAPARGSVSEPVSAVDTYESKWDGSQDADFTSGIIDSADDIIRRAEEQSESILRGRDGENQVALDFKIKTAKILADMQRNMPFSRAALQDLSKKRENEAKRLEKLAEAEATKVKALAEQEVEAMIKERAGAAVAQAKVEAQKEIERNKNDALAKIKQEKETALFNIRNQTVSSINSVRDQEQKSIDYIRNEAERLHNALRAGVRGQGGVGASGGSAGDGADGGGGGGSVGATGTSKLARKPAGNGGHGMENSSLEAASIREDIANAMEAALREFDRKKDGELKAVDSVRRQAMRSLASTAGELGDAGVAADAGTEKIEGERKTGRERIRKVFSARAENGGDNNERYQKSARQAYQKETEGNDQLASEHFKKLLKLFAEKLRRDGKIVRSRPPGVPNERVLADLGDGRLVVAAADAKTGKEPRFIGSWTPEQLVDFLRTRVPGPRAIEQVSGAEVSERAKSDKFTIHWSAKMQYGRYVSLGAVTTLY